MNTYLSVGLTSFEDRISELNVLLAIADSYSSESDEHNAICRSIQVLLVGHFEGVV